MDTNEQMRTIQTAYAILSDPETRKEYDQQRKEFDSLSLEKKLKAKAKRKVKTDIVATIEGFNVKAHSQSATIQVGIQESEN